MTGTGRDVIHAARLLWRSPGFSLAAIATLALGIGANTAMFTLADATLLRPLQIADPDHLLALPWSSSYPDYREYRDRTDVFSGVAGVALKDRVLVQVDAAPELRTMAFLSGDAFTTFGVSTVAGRPLQAADDDPGAPLVAVASYAFWQSRFGGDPGIVGRVVQAAGRPLTIVGVVQEGFRGTSLSYTPQLFLPLTAIRQVTSGITARPEVLTSRGLVWMTVFGRLKPGVTPEQASAVMETVYRRQHPLPNGAPHERLRLVPLTTRALGGGAEGVHRFVVLLVSVVAVTLIVGCANLANLLLARGTARRREIGVRLALGAGRGRVVRQMLAESVLLAVIGGATGVLVARLALRVLAAFELPGGLDISRLDLHVNGGVLVATAGLSILTGLLFGAAPAWRASRTDALDSIRGATRGATARSALRSVLLGVQVALCLVLLAGAGLFLRSLANALAVPLGFDPAHTAVASVNLSLAGFEPARQRAFYAEALRRVRAQPQVTAAGWATSVPAVGVWMFQQEIAGYTPKPDESLTFYVAQVDAGYFPAAGTRIVEGRSFTESDRPNTEPVVIVNEEAARRFFGGHAIGGRLKSGAASPWYRIVGVAENTIIRELGERREPMVYFDFDQPFTDERSSFMLTAHLFARVSGDPADVLPSIYAQLTGVDARAPVYEVETFEQAVRGLAMPQRMGMTLLSSFALLALALACVGIYGVGSYIAALRTREIGIRVALGASRSEIRRLMIGLGFRPVAIGLLAGAVLALWLAPLASAFLYGLSPRDPLTLGSVAALLTVVALTATWLPARRAAAMAPVTALRAE